MIVEEVARLPLSTEITIPHMAGFVRATQDTRPMKEGICFNKMEANGKWFCGKLGIQK